jgi:hypothetical protein
MRREGDLRFNFKEGSGIVPVVGGEHLRSYVGGDYAKVKECLASC